MRQLYGTADSADHQPLARSLQCVRAYLLSSRQTPFLPVRILVLRRTLTYIILAYMCDSIACARLQSDNFIVRTFLAAIKKTNFSELIMREI